MLLKKKIPMKYVLGKIKVELLLVIIYATTFSLIHQYYQTISINIPIALPTIIGTIISLLLAFKSNQAYDRWWEARIVWGAIVNDSRTLIRQVISFYKDPDFSVEANNFKENFARRQASWCYSLGQSLRDKETTYYKQSGATEFAAQSSAQGKVQEKGYYASLPIPYIINNIPTYVMTLKDDGGLVKMFAMVDISDYTIVGVGNTMRETLMAYKNVYNMADNGINPESITSKKTVNSIVTRIGIDVKNGNSFYYFTVKDYPNVFVGSSQLSNELPVTRVGDSVRIAFDVDLEQVIDVSTFDNRNITK